MVQTPSADAVLVMAYGGPGDLDEVEPFMCELMGARPSDEVCARVKRRYLAIGGSSPLPQIARDFAAAIESSMVTAGAPLPVEVGFKYTSPRIADALTMMYQHGVRRVVTFSLSPFESKTTTEAYRAAVEEAAAHMPGLEVVEAPLMSRIPAFLDAHAGFLSVALTDLPEEASAKVLVVFSAHSLPVADLQSPIDPYVEGLQLASQYVASKIGLDTGQFGPVLTGVSGYGSAQGERPWILAYQSKGQRGGEWLEPSLDDVIDAAVSEGYSAVAVCPIGFATEHMETLYDLDVVAAGRALDADMEFVRSAAPNAHETVVLAVGDAIRSIVGLDSGVSREA
ncbi:MAG: ferrochelatase [Coriobacteriia bacterium]|nr:ferrochelatase [Coriobacteriia bacterium]